MNSQEKNIIKKEKEQIRAFLEAIKRENNTIGNRMASIEIIAESTKASQVRVCLMLAEFEAKLNKIK